MEQAKPVMSQKEYLKRYLMKDKDKKSKKKKKHANVSSSTHLKRSVVIDDDISIEEIPRVVNDEFTLDHLGDEAPQIVGVVDERPEEVKLAEKYESGRWRPLDAKENQFDASSSTQNASQDDLWGVQAKKKRDMPRPTKAADSGDLDLSPPRPNSENKGRYSSVKADFKGKSKSTLQKSSPRRNARDESDSDLEVPRPQKIQSEKDRKMDKHHSRQNRLDSSDRNVNVQQNRKESIDTRGDSATSRRDRKSQSPSLRKKDDRGSYPSARSNKMRNRYGNRSKSPPRKKHDCGSNSVVSPPGRGRHGRGVDNSSSKKRKGDSDSDKSPFRRPKRGGSSSSSTNTDLSPDRRRRRDGNDSDLSPPRRKGGRDSDTPPPRRKKGSRDSNLPPLRKRKSGNDSDFSPPRRRKGGNDSDLSPPRRRNPVNNSGLSPPGRRKRGSSDSDLSPPRRRKTGNDSDLSPPRRRRGGSDSDLSPPRRRKTVNNSNLSPSGKKGGRNETDSSPPRTGKRGHKSDVLRHKNERGSRGSGLDSELKSDSMQDGKKAGLQDAKSLKDELRILKQKEDDMFRQMDPELLGRSTAAVVRDRKTGLKRNFEKEREVERKKAAKNAVRQKKYEKWGKGLKQVQDQEERVADMVHEMSKPLARYADDDDLERALKAQEREGDPMLEYIRRHQKESHSIDLTVGGTRKKYQGSYLPNRFNIAPGHRWDGVDRSNGYEQKWFEAKNSKKAVAEEAWKWSSADM